MKPPMAPPPPRNPNTTPPADSMPPPSITAPSESLEAEKPEAVRDGNPNPHPDDSVAAPPPPEVEGAEEPDAVADGGPNRGSDDSAGAPPPQRPLAPYVIPAWSAAPVHPFYLEVLKDGVIIETLDVSKKGAYMFGRIDLCDFVLEHPTISRFHAVLQFREDGGVFLYDLGSTHGSLINKVQVKKKLYTEIHVGDVIRFGLSSRLYIFQGPSELMPPERDMQKLQDAKVRQEMLDREASLLRAKTQAALAEGISWGMADDAVEEAAEDDVEEITWQTYKGQLTDRQEKTRSKVIKRMEKVANMKKEIDAIRAKDIAQGGLTQGQQTQIARNEQRISQIMEELENLEETLNESIRESLGARAGKAHNARHKASLEEDDDIPSDDDEFYDRTKKKPSGHKSGEQQSVETADSLLEKKDSIMNDMESKRKLLEGEKNKLVQRDSTEDGDDLDAYMSGLSSQLVHDKIAKIQKELSDLQVELDRVVYLLKIADPMGEAVRRRNLKPLETKAMPIVDNREQASSKESKIAQPGTSLDEKLKESSNGKLTDKLAETEKDISKEANGKPAYTVSEPQWLGDKRITEAEENYITEGTTDAEEQDNFVDYKDRKTALAQSSSGKGLEEAAPGLIIRKKKPVDQASTTSDEARSVGVSSSIDPESSAADAVALLLKHKRGYHPSEEDMEDGNELQPGNKKEKKSKQRRVLGPSRPDFLGASPDYESWVPPEGQTGDGRTALNDRLGY